jgi:outer membrane protein OmpA-like peptidoglycan-associated protein
MKTASLLLAGTALVALGFHSLPAGAVEQSFIVAQANPKADEEPRAGRRAQERQQQQQQQQAPAARPQQPQAPAPQNNRSVQQEAPRLQSAPRNEPPPARVQNEPPARVQSEQRPPAAQQQPAQQERSTQQTTTPQSAPQTQTPPARVQNEQRPPAAAQRDDRRQLGTGRDDRRPAAQQQPGQQERPAQQTTTPQNERDRRNQNADQQRDRTSPTQTQTGQPPAQTGQPPTQTGQTPATNERGRQQQAGEADQARPRDASEFIRRDSNVKARTVDDLRRERREERQGDRTVIREGDRTIVREGNRNIIRHNETTRFTIGARGVNVQRVGGETRTIVERPGGVRIVTVTDANGRLLRRVRIVNGREFVLINNSFRGPNYQVFVMLPPPVIRIPRERYIVDYRVGMPAPVIYETLLAEPVEPIAERYTIEQVRYSEPVRARMPRVDLDLNFETGSWQLTPEQIEKLNVIADGIKRATERNPQEVFLIEGHTDAVGSDEDNLSLSDRRAEAVAVALTEQYQVPPENLVTQGYGEQNPKVDTQGPSEENRRVSVRRVTPLLAQEQGTTGGGGRPPQ